MTPQQTLTRTLNIVKQQPKLAKRMFWDDSSDCACLIGAVRIAACGANLPTDEYSNAASLGLDPENISSAAAAINFLKEAANARNLSDLFEFNDSHTKAEVEDLLESALALATSAQAASPAI